MSLLETGIAWVERGRVPDLVTRRAIRRLCQVRLQQPTNGDEVAFRASLHQGPIALVPERANDQHYELPAEFFTAVLGLRMKYSCCLWPRNEMSLADAEDAALAETCKHAELADGQEILELGCGWGSLSLWIAEQYPHSRITAVSNSASQRAFIETAARTRGLSNLSVVTCDMNEFSPAVALGAAKRFDRIVSVEMFEHMRNYQLLLARIATWLAPDGRLFVHLFCHRDRCYPFDAEGAANWMGRLFFSGGLMPSADLLVRMNRDMSVVRHWKWSGCDYQQTAEAWLANLEAHRDAVLRIFRICYGAEDALLWFHRWRTFFLAVSELFGYADGEEWFVSHYLLTRNDVANDVGLAQT